MSKMRIDTLRDADILTTQDYRKSCFLIFYSFHFKLSYQYWNNFLMKFAELGFATSLVVEAF